MNEREVLKLTLAALKQIDEAMPFPVAKLAIMEAEKALAQPEQEPVAWPCVIAEADFSENIITLTMQCTDYKVSAGKHWLSTTPPQRTWVGLTDEERREIGKPYFSSVNTSDVAYARAIEAKLKEKNT